MKTKPASFSLHGEPFAITSGASDGARVRAACKDEAKLMHRRRFLLTSLLPALPASEAKASEIDGG